MKPRSFLSAASFTLLTALTATVQAGNETLRVVTWNTSQYKGGHTADLQTAVYGTYQNRSMRPDVILAQEIQSASAAAEYVKTLNGAAGSTGDWAASFKNLTGTDKTNDQVVFYRTGKLTVVGTEPTLIRASQGDAGTARDVYRWDFRLKNDVSQEVLSFYNVHLKSGSSGTEDARRLDATKAIRADANNLSSDHRIIIGGDFNVQRATQNSYEALVGSSSDNDGRFYDPINSAGSWNGNSDFRFLHTQDPTGPGGMDDRHDQILLGKSFFDGVGTDYVGDATQAYSTTTWNDPNHSYRCWGNDGTTFDKAMAISGNTMVGSSIAQSLANMAGTAGGHLPVFLDIRYQAVPEPASLFVLGLGVAAVLRRRSRR